MVHLKRGGGYLSPCEKRFFAPFIYKNDDFAKTGSGQT
jgi:hypothetical protein